MKSSALEVNVILRWEKKKEKGSKEIVLAQERPEKSETWFRGPADVGTFLFTVLW